MKKINICENCLDETKNPICVDCYMNYLKNWFENSKIDRRFIKNFISEIDENIQLSVVSYEIKKCTICKMEKPSLCSNCFFLKVEKAIKNMHVEKQLKNNFLEIFIAKDMGV